MKNGNAMDLARHQQKKALSCAVGNDSTAQKLQGVGDYILILNSHFSGCVRMEATGIVKKKKRLIMEMI